MDVPIGAQNQVILEKMLQRQKDFAETEESSIALFQTLFSHRAVAAHYLGKFEPFLTVQRLLQNGVCDSIDR